MFEHCASLAGPGALAGWQAAGRQRGWVLLFVEASRRWAPSGGHRRVGPERRRARSPAPKGVSAARGAAARLSLRSAPTLPVREWRRAVTLLTVVIVIVTCFRIGTMVYPHENVEWFPGKHLPKPIYFKLMLIFVLVLIKIPNSSCILGFEVVYEYYLCPEGIVFILLDVLVRQGTRNQVNYRAISKNFYIFLFATFRNFVKF